MGNARADWCDLLDERELVNVMDRATREAKILDNHKRNADTLDDQAMRKYQRARREQDGYHDANFVEREPAKPQLVFKTYDGASNPIAPLEPSYVARLATADTALEILADEVGTITGRLERELILLRKRVEELESK